MRVAVLFNAAEVWDDVHHHEVLDPTPVVEALSELGHEVTLVPVNTSILTTLAELRPNIVFNAATGGSAGTHRRVFAPACLDMLGLPYTGSDPLTAALCHDKMSCKEVLSLLKIPSPRGFLVNEVSALKSHTIEFPVVVKPNNGTGATGIAERSLCKNMSDLIMSTAELLDDGFGPVLVEEYIQGTNVSVTVLGSWPDLTLLPMVQLDPAKLEGMEVYGAEARDFFTENPFSKTALHPKVHNALLDFASNAYAHLGCRDWARLDFIVGTDQTPYLIDVETVPDFSPLERVTASVQLDGAPLSELIQFVLNTAITRAGVMEEEPDVED